jgi:coenzyme F420-reducing hydrogenase delta subunit
MRLSYPTNIKVIKVPCTGKVDVLYLMKTFQNGADGVYVAGCMEGDCHYLTGNLRARKRVEYTKKILEDIGIGGDRLEMYNMSAAEGPRFVEVANEMMEKIQKLGPSPVKKVTNNKVTSLKQTEKIISNEKAQSSNKGKMTK